ncbi:MAG: phosphatidylglycerophosphatase A [Gammaproteobacteria bacterium]|nr:phosphatidylglycerophosphatase A [Gammaproteobacteria bacterium]MBU2178573.1 phosphatidylglycerophosphatase A [Gammaproteobacteria bacterium]
MKNHPFNLSKWQHWLALGFGSGLAPKAPGTFGTLAALPLLYLVWPYGIYWVTAFIVLGTLLGIYVCDVVSRDIGIADHGSIVWDEVIGFAITLWAVPLTLSNVVVAFMLFRLLDIGKPWPIRWFDRNVHGGLGVMLDDIVAGILACALLHSVWLPLQI